MRVPAARVKTVFLKFFRKNFDFSKKNWDLEKISKKELFYWEVAFM